MKILKFGGSSLKTTERIEHVVCLIAAEHPCGVVVSAFGGVTDQLIELINLAESGLDYNDVLNAFLDRHLETVSGLQLLTNLDSIHKSIQTIGNELQQSLKIISDKKQDTPKLKDTVLSAGERFSANIIREACIENGLNADYLDARKVIVTDDHFGSAFVHYQKSYNNIRNEWIDKSKTRIITGFIGATESGETTTFGRSGSDYTAAIFGAALHVDEVEIWTDVNGILSADPNVVPNAKTILNITYEEAMELAHAGAKVIFPPTMIPALYKSIPIRIRNTFEPGNPGTVITQNRETDNNFAVGISSLYNVSLIRFQGAGMVGRYGVIGRVFEALAQKKINIILVSQVFSEHSICFAIQPSEVGKAETLLKEEFTFELENRFIDSIKIENDLSLIAVVGEGMRHTPGISGKLFSVLGEQNVNVIAIAQGSSERNISFIIKNDEVKSAIRSLHNYIFSDYDKINVFIAGVGLVGSSLIRLIQDQSSINICGILNSSKMVINQNGVDPNLYTEELNNGEPADVDTFILTAAQSRNAVFVDVTSSSIIAEKTANILQKGISVVSASKLANSMNQDYYNQIRQSEKQGQSTFKYETNVGAGLPIMETLQTLLNTGDTVEKIEGIMSGTLSYLFSQFDGSLPFSELVKNARSQGYTEPDPRDDLNGMDVGRKILILARETGAKLEIDNVSIQNLIPEELSPTLSIDEFLDQLPQFDDQYLNTYTSAKNKNKVLRYIASWDGQKAVVELKAIGGDNPFYHQSGRENFIVFTTKRYKDTPMIIKGHGAGAEVTAAGVLGDILKCQ
ncbi:MAG: bifunctional aspartate kinase/homoserine dehydrogenase I [Candidatus Marinimicrobia bacterium]|jgi:aspartokinase/homoserine dehydrogenase 1|nr:bifunctional aspartate kinase/homoserine dehydrogenase I [Candidatus Neomarinimicrobiota bacterium]MBT3961387.1 bifunctional aspartate kinase/homoserine dehydrogenase I [Candidatus Neomarinimicrobiota bacterium]MBT4382751.1 bifunctional aspartate kinase/homoserine dehydrogenase I [Candidatus Neomarinimicrobiota bacterium]MBT4636620.1 bifunctional aspartate kinase/homoserine dehydrogenase I [Candidatus Neomarinimicrobiota bacterium]MBT4684738.1 bifunctional aspartate kinase/homoserine dehydro